MLLNQLLESPKTSSKLLVSDPFQALDREQLVKEVIGLANARVDGPRNILFGVNAGAVESHGIVGIPDSAIGDLKKAHRLLSAFIEPVLHLAFIFDRINGKLVGALEIDGCEFGPFFVGQDFSETLSRGQCWIREGRELRAVDRSDLVNDEPAPAPKPPADPDEEPAIAVGFNDQIDCQVLELSVPDTSNPPFVAEQPEARRQSKLKKAIKDTVGTVTMKILSLGQPRKAAEDGQSDKSGIELNTEVDDGALQLVEQAQKHYYFEEKALHLNLTVCNKGNQDIEGASIELGFPRLPDFDVAERLYTSPFDKRSPPSIKKEGYPKVDRREDAIYVRGRLALLAPGRPKQAFRCAMRLAVGPGMRGRKMAILYKLRGPDQKKLGDGRLKIVFAKTAA